MATSAPALPAADERHRPHQVLLVLLLACASFALTQTLVIPALPVIATELQASPSATSWVLTGFLLSASVATPIVGKLGDVYGRGRVLTAVLTVFALGSAVNALAPTIEVLIAGRVLQGVAGGVFPLAFGVVRDTSPSDKVPGHLALLSAVFGIGGGIGLPMSGVIVDHTDIAWLFWLGLFAAAPAAVAAHQLIPSSPSAVRVGIDWFGALLLSAALASMLLGVSRGEQWGWTSPTTVALIAGGLVLAVVWIKVESRIDEPLIQLSLLRERAVAATNLTACLIGMAMFSSFLLIPQFAQTPAQAGYGFGFSVTASGLLLVPSAIVQIVVGPLAGRLGVRIGFRRVLAIGTLSCTASFLVLAIAHSSPWQFVVAGMLLGGGICFAFASMANLVVAAAPAAQVGIATGINTVVRTVGGAFGAAVATAILAAHVIGATGLPSEGAYTAAFVFSSIIGLAATGAALLVPTRVESSATPDVETRAQSAS